MKYLIDTHVLLWLVDENPAAAIPGPILDALAQQRHDILVSAVTPWEISLKHWMGKLPKAAPVLAQWDSIMARLSATGLTISDRHAILAGRLDWTHKDPFDRMLAAQAMLEDATLVSKDPVFCGVPGLRTAWDFGGDSV
ncbi:MAG: type II toxin-antitoxin system VapC family toxin [Propionibacteriaceae bacterium]|jgi:PIN domain nuclease of toxin-antitoxin system|nr:type II toxin-antitoxin system VapC family toxin [Propionibacteriaceae bacterium]